MKLLLVILLSTSLHIFVRARGGACKSIRKSYPKLKGPRKPLLNATGLCPIEKSCCSEEIARALYADAKLRLTNAVRDETAQAQGTLQMIKDMTGQRMKDMIGDLIPANIAKRLDVEALGEHIWNYSMGKISSSELTVEVAVIASSIVLTSKVKPGIKQMLECIIRELAVHAQTTFIQLASIIDEVLEAPRTFGYGFEVADTLLNALERTQLTPECSIGQLGGCHRCNNKYPGPCRSLCLLTTRECLSNVNNMIPLWTSWVESTVYLVKSMTAMIELKIDPNDLITPELIETLTNDITKALFSADFAQCQIKRGIGKRSTPETPELHTIVQYLEKRSVEKMHVFSISHVYKRAFDESAMLRSLLSDKFSSLERASCIALGAEKGDDECWLGHVVGTYNNTISLTTSQIQRETSPVDDDVATDIKRYEELVGAVSDRISEKLRVQALKPAISSEYRLYSRAETDLIHYYLIIALLSRYVLQFLVF